MEKTTDEIIFKRILNGDTSAFEEAIGGWHNTFVGFLCKMVNSQDALDIAQDTYLALIKNFHVCTSLAHAKRFLFKAGYRKAIDLIRKNKRRSTLLETINTEPQREEPQLELTGIFEKLTPKEKAVMDLKITQDMSYPEVAKYLGIPLGTVLFRSHTAIKKIKKYFVKDGGMAYEKI